PRGDQMAVPGAPAPTRPPGSGVVAPRPACVVPGARPGLVLPVHPVLPFVAGRQPPADPRLAVPRTGGVAPRLAAPGPRAVRRDPPRSVIGETVGSPVEAPGTVGGCASLVRAARLEDPATAAVPVPAGAVRRPRTPLPRHP